MNPAKTLFLNPTLFSRASSVDTTHEGTTSFALAWLDSTVVQYTPHGLSHTVIVASPDMAWLSHASSFDVTGPSRCLWPSSFLPSLSFFLLFHLVATPLVILDFTSLIRAYGTTNQPHEFVFQSCWIRTSSLPSQFLVFWKLRLDELMW
jgi:hypothetical protein